MTISNNNNSLHNIFLKNEFGINVFQLNKACRIFGYKPFLKWGFLKSKKTTLKAFFEKDLFQVKSNHLKESITKSISRLVLIRCHRGVRMRLSLPVRGQRTKTNKKTSKKLNHLLK